MTSKRNCSGSKKNNPKKALLKAAEGFAGSLIVSPAGTSSGNSAVRH
jgi:predicted RNA-binding protein YlxR (DUF448 family)